MLFHIYIQICIVSNAVHNMITKTLKLMLNYTPLFQGYTFYLLHKSWKLTDCYGFTSGYPSNSLHIKCQVSFMVCKMVVHCHNSTGMVSSHYNLTAKQHYSLFSVHTVSVQFKVPTCKIFLHCSNFLHALYN